MLRATSQARRVAADEMNGAVHDPWIPLSLRSEQVSAFNAQKNGFAYFRFANVLLNSSAYKLPLLARPSSTEVAAGRPATLIASALPYGKRGTEGMLYREVSMPMPVLFAIAEGDVRLSERARAFVDLAGKAGGQVLRPALVQFIDGSDDVDWKHPDPARMATPWLARLEAEIDACFFSTLFDTITRPLSDTDAQSAWEAVLARAVLATFTPACEALATRNSSRHFAQARAERLLQNAWRKQFGGALHGVTSSADQEAAPA